MNIAKKTGTNTSHIYNPRHFLKSNIITANKSDRPALTNQGFIQKRSILGSIEAFEKQIKLNSYDIATDGTQYRQTKVKANHNALIVKPKSSNTEIEYHGIKQIVKEQKRAKNGFSKNETTYDRKKSKVDMLKGQSLQKMHKYGSRGFVILNGGDNSTKSIKNHTKEYPNDDDDPTMQYNDNQTATIFFHETGVERAKRGQKVPIYEADLKNIEDRLKNRQNRSRQRKKRQESKMDKNHQILDLKSKRHLELYKKRSREWRVFNNQSSKMLKRSNTQSLYSAIDKFREKCEERELVDK